MYGIVEIQAEKTLKDFNIDVNKLHSGSHTKVYVKCTKCGEIFLREYRNKGQLHSCPTKITRDDGTPLKWCNSCKQFLTLVMFSGNKARQDNMESVCKVCSAVSPNSIRHNLKKIFLRNSDLNSWLKWSFMQKRASCKKKGIDFDLDYEFLLSQWKKQDGCCYYFNIPMLFGVKNLESATLERINSSIGYTKENVVFASRMANHAKNDSGFTDFNNILLKIVTKLAYGTTPRIEILKRHPDAVIPHRSRASDAGYDIHSLNDVVINPSDIINIDSGLVVVAPFGYYITVEGRSSMYKSGVVPFRGIIDSGYTGNMVVSLMNVGTEPYYIAKGDRIAQLTLHKLVGIDFAEVKAISDDYDIRGDKGFGSSGR